MDSAAREQLRLSLLRFLDANAGSFGLPTDFLYQTARAEGRHYLSKPELEAEIQYLVDKGFLEQVRSAISPERRAWRITAAGRDTYAALHGS